MQDRVGCNVALGQELDLLPSFCGPGKGYIPPVISAIVCLKVLPGGPELPDADVKQRVGELEGRWPRAFFFENNSARQFPAEYVAPDSACSSSFHQMDEFADREKLRSKERESEKNKIPIPATQFLEASTMDLLSNSET
jgi:hypothetical protein